MRGHRAAITAALLLASVAAAGAAPRRAADFIDSIGANVHLGAADTGYRDVDGVARQLDYLGIRHVRADLLDIANLAPYRHLGAHGIRFDLIVMTPPEAAIPVLRSLAAFVSTIEGPNEVNVTPVNYHGLTGEAGAVALQRSLYRIVKADPILRRIPVLNFSVAQGGKFEPYGDLSAVADYTNVHAYAEYGVPPFWMLKPVIDAVTDTPGRPAMVTEVGNTTLPDGKSGVSEAVQAKWLLNTLLDTFREHAVATFVYELQDERPDAANSDPELHYGLFRTDAHPKAAADALHNLTGILGRRGNGSAPQPPMQAPPLAPPFFQLTLAHDDGSLDLVIWAEPEIWDHATRSEKPAPARMIEMRFAAPVTATIFDPLIGMDAIERHSQVDSARISVTDHPVILHVEAPAARLP